MDIMFKDGYMKLGRNYSIKITGKKEYKNGNACEIKFYEMVDYEDVFYQHSGEQGTWVDKEPYGGSRTRYWSTERYRAPRLIESFLFYKQPNKKQFGLLEVNSFLKKYNFEIIK